MVVLWVLAGGVVELVNTFLRKESIRFATSRKPMRSVLIVVVGFAIRLAWTGLIFSLALRHNPLSGMAVLVGYWLFRWVVIWWLTKH